MTQIHRKLGRAEPPTTAAPRPPTDAERAWVEQMGDYRTRVPKGVFRYRSHEEANRDWERWQVDAIVERGR